MRNLSLIGALAGACTLAASLAWAQEAGAPDTPAPLAAQQKAEIRHGSPARWFKDDRTLQARMKTVRKEVAAAYEEAKIGCRREPGVERNACLREARSNYDHDMADARDIAISSR